MNEKKYDEIGAVKSLFYDEINDRSLYRLRIVNFFLCEKCNYSTKIEFSIENIKPFCRICHQTLILQERNFKEKTIIPDNQNKFDNIEDSYLKYFVICIIWEIRNETIKSFDPKKLKEDFNKWKANIEINVKDDFKEMEYYEMIKNKIMDSHDFILFNNLNENYFTEEQLNKIYFNNFKNLYQKHSLFRFLYNEINKIKNINANIFKNSSTNGIKDDNMKNINNINYAQNQIFQNCDSRDQYKIGASSGFLEDTMLMSNDFNELQEIQNLKNEYGNCATKINKEVDEHKLYEDENIKDLLDDVNLYLIENEFLEEDSIDEQELKNNYDILHKNFNILNKEKIDEKEFNKVDMFENKEEILNDCKENYGNCNNIPLKKSHLKNNNNHKDLQNISLISQKLLFKEIENCKEIVKDIHNHEVVSGNSKINIQTDNDIDEKETSEINIMSKIEKSIPQVEHLIISNIKKNFNQINEKENEWWEKKNDCYTKSRLKFLEMLNSNKIFYSKEEFKFLLKLDEVQYRNQLRVYAFKDAIIKSIEENEITIVVSEPGSGKTTQIVQYCLNLKSNKFICKKPIWCTQPRKISCVTVSERVSDEMNDYDYKIVKTLIKNNYITIENNETDENFDIIQFIKETLYDDNIESDENNCYENISKSQFNDRDLLLHKNLINNKSRKVNKKRKPEYKINNIEKETKIIFSTENVLLNELIEDPYLKKVDVLIIDEAHERSLNLDIILYFLKNYTLKRDNFRLIITSATLNYKQFYNYFTYSKYNIINQIEQDYLLIQEALNNDSSAILQQKSIFGNKKYQVLIQYSDNEIDSANFQNKTIDFLFNLLTEVIKDIEDKEKIYNARAKTNNTCRINQNNLSEFPVSERNEYQENTQKNFLTILVFLPDTKSILYLKEHLSFQFYEKMKNDKLYIFQLYGSLNYSDQNKIIGFYCENSVKLILSTNIAETSVTIPYCNIVVDTGLQKIRRYNYNTKLLEDTIELISKDSAFQRQGRCGRIDKGICYKLYTKEQFNLMNEFRIAEVSRVNISYMILKLIYFGISNVFNVELIEQPQSEDISRCIDDLMTLKAIYYDERQNNSNNDNNIHYRQSYSQYNEVQDFANENYNTTKFGQWLYQIELEPSIGRVLYDCIEQYRFGLSEVLMIISSITVGDNLFNNKRNNNNMNFPPFVCSEVIDSMDIINEYTKNYDNENNFNKNLHSQRNIFDKDYENENFIENIKIRNDNIEREQDEDVIKLITDDPLFDIEEILILKSKKYIDCLVHNIFADVILSYEYQENLSNEDETEQLEGSPNKSTQIYNCNDNKNKSIDHHQFDHKNADACEMSIYDCKKINDISEKKTTLSKISSDCLNIIKINNFYLENINSLSTYFEIFKELNKFYNPSTYFIENHISSLGDMMIGLFSVRQFQKIHCFSHYDLIFEKENYFKIYLDDIPAKGQRYGCKNCIKNKLAYLKMYNLNSKNIRMQRANYKNLKKILEVFYSRPLLSLEFPVYAFEIEASYLEYKLAYWNSIYNLLHTQNYQRLFEFFNLNSNELLKDLKKIDFKDIFMKLYKHYRKFYIDIVGPCFFKVFSYNTSIKPNIIYYENKKRKNINYTHELHDYYLLVNNLTKSKINKHSLYNKYFAFLDWKKENNLYTNLKDLDEYNLLVYAIQITNTNEINLRNVNPIYPLFLKCFDREIKIELKKIYFNNAMKVFCISNIGPYLISYLVERKKILEKQKNLIINDENSNNDVNNTYENFRAQTFNHNKEKILNNPLLKMISFNIKGNDNSVIFLTDNSTFKSDQAYIMGLIDAERKNVKENFIEEIGYLNRDCLVLKIKHGFEIVNIEYNKDPIHFKIIFRENFDTLQNFDNIIKSKGMKFNKLYFNKNYTYISFKNSNQANVFSQQVKCDIDLADKFTLNPISEDLIYSYDDNYNNSSKNILSVMVDRELDKNSIESKLSEFGRVKDIMVKSVGGSMNINFIMNSNFDTNNILTKFKAHEDKLGKWSSVKMINRNFDIYVDGKYSISNKNFWTELNLFMRENNIKYYKNKNKISIREFSDFSIRKVLNFLSEDILQLCDFSLMETKLNCRNSFFKIHGLSFKDFCIHNKVYIEFFHYMKKLHIYGTPPKRDRVTKIINNYLDFLSNDLKHQIISLITIFQRFSVSKLNKDYCSNEIQIFNEISNLKKTLLVAVARIRDKYINMKIYIELNFDSTKNQIELKARKKDFINIMHILNKIFENLIISNIQMNPVSNNKKQDDLQVLDLYKDIRDYISCQICLEPLNEKNLIKLALCGDVYCKECIKNSIILQINAQPVAELPIKCSLCNEVILNADIFRLFRQNERKFLFYQLTKYFMTKKNFDRDLNWCENPNCQFLYRKNQFIEIHSIIRNCPNCLKTFCLLCSSELIDDYHNQKCKTLLLKNLDINNRKWVIKNTTNCPKCNQIYEKSLGCNHMICKKCIPEIHFCYICGRILDKNNPYNHFNNEKDFPYCYQNLHNNQIEKLEKEQIPNLNLDKEDSIKEEEKENIFHGNFNDIVENQNQHKIEKFKVALIHNNFDDTYYVKKEHQDFFAQNPKDEELEEMFSNSKKNNQFKAEKYDPEKIILKSDNSRAFNNHYRSYTNDDNKENLLNTSSKIKSLQGTLALEDVIDDSNENEKTLKEDLSFSFYDRSMDINLNNSETHSFDDNKKEKEDNKKKKLSNIHKIHSTKTEEKQSRINEGIFIQDDNKRPNRNISKNKHIEKVNQIKQKELHKDKIKEKHNNIKEKKYKAKNNKEDEIDAYEELFVNKKLNHQQNINKKYKTNKFLKNGIENNLDLDDNIQKFITKTSTKKELQIKQIENNFKKSEISNEKISMNTNTDHKHIIINLNKNNNQQKKIKKKLKDISFSSSDKSNHINENYLEGNDINIYYQNVAHNSDKQFENSSSPSSSSSSENSLFRSNKLIKNKKHNNIHLEDYYMSNKPNKEQDLDQAFIYDDFFENKKQSKNQKIQENKKNNTRNKDNSREFQDFFIEKNKKNKESLNFTNTIENRNLIGIVRHENLQLDNNKKIKNNVNKSLNNKVNKDQMINSNKNNMSEIEHDLKGFLVKNKSKKY